MDTTGGGDGNVRVGVDWVRRVVVDARGEEVDVFEAGGLSVVECEGLGEGRAERED